MERFNQYDEGCSPSIFADNKKNDTCLWISAMGEQDNLDYIIGYHYPKKVKKYWLFGDLVKKDQDDIYLLCSSKDAIPHFKLIFNQQEVSLQEAPLSKKDRM